MAIPDRRQRLSGVSPLARASKRSKAEDVAKILKEADADGDGVLSLADLQGYLGDYLGYGDAEIRSFFEKHKAGDGVDLEGFQKGFASLNPYLISKRTGENIVRKPGSVCAPGGQMNLEDLEDCTVLVCDRSQQVFVDECKNCQVLIGPCDSSTFVRDCKGCTFWIATRQLRTRDCTDCTFFLHSHTEPIIESSKDLGFAPFCASYPGIARHFEEAKMDAGLNFWTAIYDFTGRADGANWRILPVEECKELAVKLSDEADAPGSWHCPTPSISHDLLCASPPQSQEGSAGKSVVSVPQTRPSKPAEPAPGTKPKRLNISDSLKEETEQQPAANSCSMPDATAAAAASSRGPQPAKKLRKPKWTTVAQIDPDSRGVNIFAKVVKILGVVESKADEKITEVVLGDASGVLTLRARGEQVAVCEPGQVLRIQNARVVMVKGFIRLVVTKWGVVKPAPDHEDISPKVGNDISSTEYELA